MFDIPDVQFYFPDLPVGLLFVDLDLSVGFLSLLPDLPVGLLFVGSDLSVGFLFLFPDLPVGLLFVDTGLPLKPCISLPDLPVGLFFVSLYLLFEPVAKGAHFPAHFQCGSRVLLMHYIFDVGNCQICHIFVDDVVALVRVVLSLLFCYCCYLLFA